MKRQAWSLFRSIGLLIAGSVLIGLAVGCAPTPTPRTLPTATPPDSPAAPTAAATSIPTSERPTAVPTAVATSSPAAYARVEVASVGLSFEVPADWTQLEPEWAWSPAPGSPVRLGLRWADVEPPAEVEAVLLPQPAVVQSAEPLDTSWGSGRLYTVAVYDPSGQGLLQAMEEHAIIVVTEGGTRRAYDLYASAASDAELGALRPTLLHMVESSTMQP